jgi:MFS family permease
VHPVTGPLESLGYILAPLLGALLGSAVMAVATAYAVALLWVVLVEALAVSAVAAVIRPPDVQGHWLRRPVAMGVVFGLGMVGAIVLSLRLLIDDAGELSSLLWPFLPAVFAALAVAVAGFVMLVRGLRDYRKRGNIAEATAIVGMLLRLVARLAATAAFALALLMVVAVIFSALSDQKGTSARDALVVGGFFFAILAALGTVLAWAGRHKPSPPAHDAPPGAS